MKERLPGDAHYQICTLMEATINVLFQWLPAALTPRIRVLVNLTPAALCSAI